MPSDPSNHASVWRLRPSAVLSFLTCLFCISILASISTAAFCAGAAAARSSSTRDGFWTRGVQDSPDLEASLREVTQHPDNAIANNDYGWALRMNGKPAQAVTFLRKAISLNPSMSQPYSNLSVIMLELGNVDRSVGYARKAVELDSNQPVYRVVLGNALTKQHSLDEAINQYKAALSLKSNYENAHYHLGLTLSLKGDTIAAQQELSIAMGLDPNDERAVALMEQLSTIKRTDAVKPSDTACK